MKNFATLLLFVLVLAHASAPATLVFAESTGMTLDEQLSSSGYPEEVIATMDNGLKELLVSEGAEFVSAYTYEGYLHEPQVLGDYTIQAIIPNYMASFIVSQVSGAPGFRYYRVTYSWGWYFAPSFCFTDHVALAWGVEWALTGSVQSSYTAHNTDASRTFLNQTYTTDSIYGYTAHHDILSAFYQNGEYYQSEWHSGWSSAIVQSPTSGKTGWDQLPLLGKYYHQIYPFGLNFSINPVSITVSGFYHESSGGHYTYVFQW